jgi:hypothetical protein
MSALVQWGARGLSVLLLLFLGMFVVGEGILGPSHFWRAQGREALMLSLFFAAIAGLAVGLRYGIAGGTLTMLAMALWLALETSANGRKLDGQLWPFYLIFFAGALLAAGGWLQRARRH